MRGIGFFVGTFVLLTSCNSVAGQQQNRQYGNGQGYGQAQAPMQAIQQNGQYQQPNNLRPQAPPRLPQDDVCRSRLYAGLIGQHEGGIVFSSLPGRARVVKPASTEDFENNMFTDMQAYPPLVVVREYLSGQTIYSPSIRTTQRGGALGQIEADRLTIELNNQGYVTRVNCR